MENDAEAHRKLGQLDALVRQARDELERDRARLDLVLDELPVMSWTTDSQLRLTSLSGKTLSTGRPDDSDAVGCPLRDIPLFAADSRLIAAHSQALEGKSTSLRATAGGRPYDCRVRPMRDGDGRVLGCVGLAVDSSASDEAESASQETSSRAADCLPLMSPDVAAGARRGVRGHAEQMGPCAEPQVGQLSAVLKAVTDAVVLHDERGVPTHANAAAFELFATNPVGANPEGLATILNLRTPNNDPVPTDKLPWHLAARGAEVKAAEYTCHRDDGEVMKVVASAAPVARAGKTAGAVVVWRDVTERGRLLAQVNAHRRLAEGLDAQLHRERDRLQTIMEHTHAHLAYLDPEFNFVHVNTAYAEGSGYAKDDLVGQNHFELFPDPENEAIFEEAVRTGRPTSFRGKPFVYADRPERGITYWDWSLVPVQDEEGQVQGLVFSLLNVTEREHLMRQLSSEQARLKAIIENTPEAIVVTDERARITLANPVAERNYGRHLPYGEDYHVHGDLGLCYPDGTRFHPRDLPLTRAALDGETQDDLEILLIKPDGERRHLLVSSGPIRNRAGEITGAVGVFRDITGRKRIEQALRRYAKRLRVLHELDHTIIQAHSAEEIANASLSRLRQMVRCSLASVELFDTQAGESRLLAVDTESETRLHAGRRISLAWNQSLRDVGTSESYVVEDLSSIPPTPTLEALRDEGIRSFVSFPLRTQDEVLGALNVGLETKGRPASHAMAAMRDVSHQLAIGIRQAQLGEELQAYAEELEKRVAARTAALKASESRFRAVFEQAALGIVFLDRSGRIATGNGAFQEMVGEEGDELVGKRLTAFVHPDEDIRPDVAAYVRMGIGEREHLRVETRFIGAGDEVRWANIVLSLVRGEENEPRFVVAIIEDITERKKAHLALLQSQKLATTGVLAASLAHEINNPLQAVIGCLGLAQESMDEHQETTAYVGMAFEELKRAARIVSRLRDLSRPVEEQPGEPTDLNALVRSVLEVNRKDLANRGIQVVRELAEDLPRPVLAPDRLKQVLLNLTLNARDAMSEGGQLTITTTYAERDGEVRVTVADQGPGIADEVVDRMFDPFFSTKEDGTGLGLFVSQNIVENQGGRIDVETEVGEGTAFTVSFPVQPSS